MRAVQTSQLPTFEPQDAGSDAARKRGWLWRAPIDDPVDRRNAPMLQVVLLLLGGVPPLMWLYRAAFSNIPWRSGETFDLACSLALSAVALVSVYLIRRGRFQWAIRQMLVVVAASMVANYATQGGGAQTFEQPLQVVWLVLAGLMVGRPALWLMYACIVVAHAAGGWFDARAARNPLDTPANLLVSVFIEATIFLLIAVVIDRSVRALRESLDEATRHASALCRANQRLHEEMRQREQVQQQLLHAQKFEAAGRLASGVAHDFNHLLALILGYAAKRHQLDDSAELKRALEGVDAAARRATTVTHKLLDFSRQDATRLERFDLGDALQDLQPMLRQLFGPQVQVSCALPDGPAPIEFDRAQLDLIVLNIAANAQYAMPAGGRFEILLRTDERAGMLALTLRDDGHGMDEAVRAHVFEPFFTTKPAGQGTGIGLAVARNLVVAAGGEIDVESSPGRGASFHIRLPMAAPETPHA